MKMIKSKPIYENEYTGDKFDNDWDCLISELEYLTKQVSLDNRLDYLPGLLHVVIVLNNLKSS